MVLFNAHGEDARSRCPRRRFGMNWALELSTADPEAEPGSQRFQAQTEVTVISRSILVLKRV